MRPSDFEMTCTGNHVKTDVVVDEVRTVSVTVLTGECTGTANGESFEIVAVNTETFINRAQLAAEPGVPPQGAVFGWVMARLRESGLLRGKKRGQRTYVSEPSRGRRDALVVSLVILLGWSPWTRLAAQDRSFVACDLDRVPLRLEVLAHNPEVYPTSVAPPSRIPGGWLVYDRFEQQLIELDDDLNEIARWGRSGPGPMEYSQPIAVWGNGDEIVVVDQGSSICHAVRHASE